MNYCQSVEISRPYPLDWPWPRKLFVETTTRCNFRCRMCPKQAPGSEVDTGDMSLATFQALLPALPQVEALILNGLGEPLLHPHLEQFIEQAKSVMPPGSWVGFQSNGSGLDLNRACALLAAGLDRICLSLDSADPQGCSRLREGGTLAGLSQAFSALNRARNRNGAGLAIGVEFVLRRENLAALAPTMAWAAAQGADFAIVSHLMPYTEQARQQVAYELHTDAAWRLFSGWKGRADAAGLDLSRYSKTRWKYVRSPGEQRLVDLVEGMVREAGSRKIFLNLPQLLDSDQGLKEEVAASFAETEAVASRAGLDLRLPTLMPRGDRKCDFVEQGGAFISRGGQVHPCYFLWHRYRCYGSGWGKYVTPRTFGRLGDMSFLEIWNQPGYQAFRRGVLSYDFPYCPSCSTGPCDFVYAQDFTQDCYTNEFPCGDCLWCTGLFQCLQ